MIMFMSSPLTEQGIPVAPDQMREYCQFRQFDLPTCFHGKETALLVKEAFEDGDCYVTLECDVQGRKEERCPFLSEHLINSLVLALTSPSILVNLTALLRNDDSYMDYCLYHRRSYSRGSSYFILCLYNFLTCLKLLPRPIRK